MSRLFTYPYAINDLCKTNSNYIDTTIVICCQTHKSIPCKHDTITQCWACVKDGGSILNRLWKNILCSLCIQATHQTEVAYQMLLHCSMLLRSMRNSNKKPVVYSDYTSSIQFLNCSYFPNVTLKTIKIAMQTFFSASQLDCRSLISLMPANKNWTSSSSVFSIGSW